MIVDDEETFKTRHTPKFLTLGSSADLSGPSAVTARPRSKAAGTWWVEQRTSIRTGRHAPYNSTRSWADVEPNSELFDRPLTPRSQLRRQHELPLPARPPPPRYNRPATSEQYVSRAASFHPDHGSSSVSPDHSLTATGTLRIALKARGHVRDGSPAG